MTTTVKLTPTQVLRDQLVSMQALLVKLNMENANLRSELQSRTGELSRAKQALDRLHDVRSKLFIHKATSSQMATDLAFLADSFSKMLQT